MDLILAALMHASGNPAEAGGLAILLTLAVALPAGLVAMLGFAAAEWLGDWQAARQRRKARERRMAAFRRRFAL